MPFKIIRFAKFRREVLVQLSPIVCKQRQVFLGKILLAKPYFITSSIYFRMNINFSKLKQDTC